MRPSVVIMISSACLACDPASKTPADPQSADGPAPSTGPAGDEGGGEEQRSADPVPRVADAPPPATPTLNHAPGRLNYTDTERRVIYRARTGAACYVHLPFPADSRPSPGMEPPRLKATCPAPMLDESWAACAGGDVTASAPGQCACERNGNPPPPPEPIACPKVHDAPA